MTAGEFSDGLAASAAIDAALHAMWPQFYRPRPILELVGEIDPAQIEEFRRQWLKLTAPTKNVRIVNVLPSGTKWEPFA